MLTAYAAYYVTLDFFAGISWTALVAAPMLLAANAMHQVRASRPEALGRVFWLYPEPLKEGPGRFHLPICAALTFIIDPGMVETCSNRDTLASPKVLSTNTYILSSAFRLEQYSNTVRSYSTGALGRILNPTVSHQSHCDGVA